MSAHLQNPTQLATDWFEWKTNLQWEIILSSINFSVTCTLWSEDVLRKREIICGTMMGVLLLFPFYRKVKKIMKLGSSKTKIEAGECDLVSMCSAPPGCHRSALKGPRAPIIIHNLSRRNSWIIMDYHDELLRERDLRNWRQPWRSLWYPGSAGYAAKGCWSSLSTVLSCFLSAPKFPVFCFLPQVKALKQNHKRNYSSSQYRLQRKVISPGEKNEKRNSISSLHQLFPAPDSTFQRLRYLSPWAKTT